MKAAVLENTNHIRIHDRPQPSVGQTNGAVVVEVGAVGICGSDVLRFGSGKGYGFPLVLGHELAGTVAEHGAASAFKVGQKVAIFPCLPDHDDPEARKGDWAMSRGYDYLGSRSDGGMQERLLVPERNLVLLPDDLPLVIGAGVEPAAVALHGILKFGMQEPKSAVVIGAGPIGNFAAQWLRFRGSQTVILLDIDDKKLDVARELGFETLNPAGLGAGEIKEMSPSGRGFDLVVEASGSPIAFQQAIEIGAPRAEVLLLGDISSEISLRREVFTQILRKEMKLIGTWNSRIDPAHSNEWRLVIDQIGKALHIKPLVSGIYSFLDADRVLRNLFERTVWANKTVLVVSETARNEAVELFSSEPHVIEDIK